MCIHTKKEEKEIFKFTLSYNELTVLVGIYNKTIILGIITCNIYP